MKKLYQSELYTKHHWRIVGSILFILVIIGGKFTGNYIAIYASGNGKENMKAVKFDMFDYKGMI